MTLRFGVFDHIDAHGGPLREQLEERLRLGQLMERSGFFAYHLAEHHATPLGLAPSPNLFLTALAQRTSTLHFGPLVYSLPLYHPLRLFEEICLLDHLSRGRLQIGIGRGGALLEHQRYGTSPESVRPLFDESLNILLRAFGADTLNYEGVFYKIRDFPVVMKPLQKPHPPIWYGSASRESASWAAKRNFNIVSLGPASHARSINDSYREQLALSDKGPADPYLGLVRHIVVAESDKEAIRIASDAYPRWRESMEYIWRRSDVEFPLASVLPPTFEELQSRGIGFAGSPNGLRDYLNGLQAESAINYIACAVMFGNMSFSDAARSIELIGEHVIPYFATAPA
jgi:alkanesulfonate monooxygenase SsuD/methylene tetrahydromethanopterin reductase-like flavin-dependent oxidoreductase (luciferase family)